MRFVYNNLSTPGWFQNDRLGIRTKQKNVINTGTNDKNVRLASYLVSLLVTKNGKPTPYLILQCAKIIVSAILGDKASK